MADFEDFRNDFFSSNLCIKREVLEEIGINIENKNQVLKYEMKYLKIPMNDEKYYTIGVLYTGILNYTSKEFEEYFHNHTFDGEINKCYFFTTEECPNLKLNKNDISYLKKFIRLEN